MSDELVITDDDETPEEDAPEEDAPEESSGPEVVAVDDEGNEYIEGPEGGLFGDDGETNVSRTVNPSYGAKREDGLVGVGEDYPAQASRGGADSDDD